MFSPHPFCMLLKHCTHKASQSVALVLNLWRQSRKSICLFHELWLNYLFTLQYYTKSAQGFLLLQSLGKFIQCLNQSCPSRHQKHAI